VVAGELMVPAPGTYEQVLCALDRLEGFRAGDPRSHYVRVARPVRYRAPGTDRDGDWRDGVAWVYHAGAGVLAELDRAARVPGGDWLACHAA